MHKIRVNPLALKDLLDIKEYITSQLESPISAANIILKIVESYENLKDFPMLGGSLSSKMNIATDYRYLISGDYIIFYKADNVYISIYRIFYSKRDYLRILFEDKE
jgi:toxin ParE1/3/4